MHFTAAFPHKYLLNLSRRQDRRVRCEELFAEHGWSVKRQPAVDARRLESARGFGAPGRYAHAVSTRMILRRAGLAKAEAVFIFEDDVVLHPALEERLAEIELPDDWGIFYLGCQHHERPEVVSPGLVRAVAPLDTHAWGVRAEYFHEVRKALTGKYWPERGGEIPAADILLAELVRRVPAYAAYPNLAWQVEEMSDLAGGENGNYDDDGTQRHSLCCLRGVLAESLGGTAHAPAAEESRQHHAFMWTPAMQRKIPPPAVTEPAPPPLGDNDRVAFLFLTHDLHQHPGIWEEYWRGHGDRIAVYGHAKERRWLSLPGRGGWLAAAQIAEQVPTEWADVSLVRAQLALLRAALAELRNRFFVFASESCIPVRPLRDLLRLLSFDGRSRFRIQTLDDVLVSHPHKAARATPAARIPAGRWRFHSQWTLLNREAAELLAANAAMLDCFAGTHAPDECAFGTILNAAGYPVEKKVAGQDLTWSRWLSPESPHPETIYLTTPELLGDIISSGCFFARKFSSGSKPGEHGLHLAGPAEMEKENRG